MRIFRNLLLSLVIANVLILIGKEDDWLVLFRTPLHYLDMGVTFVSVFVVFEYIDWINRHLNLQLQSAGNFPKRIVLQVILGLLVPSVFAILFTFIMWQFLWEKTLLEGNYFKYEFLPQVLLIIVVNLFLLVFDLFKKATSGNARITLIAQRGNNKVPISQESVSLIQLKNGLVYLVTMDGDQLLLSNNLDAFEKLLSEEDFFRANRQIILSRKACKSFKSVENGKIQVELVSTSAPIVISQKRAARFRLWINKF